MTKTFSDPKHLRDEQYATPDNLMSRVALYDRFLQGPSLQDIRLDLAGIGKDECVIDFGCGNALIWARARERGNLPDNLTLVDLSGGMLDAAREALGDAESTLVEHDLNQPLVLDRQCDTVCAFHMLYHLRKPFAALDTMLSHLRVGGKGIVHLNAPTHLAALRRLVNLFEGGDGVLDALVQGAPSSEAVAEYWQADFSSYRAIETIQDLHVTESKPVLDYILSIETLHQGRYQDPARRQAFSQFLEAEIAKAVGKSGFYLIEAHSVLLKFEGKL